MIYSWLTKHKQQIFFYFICVTIIFVYRFPDAYAYFTTPTEMVFLGQNSWFDQRDINIYVSAIRYAQTGNLLLPNLWIAVDTQPIVLYPVEMLLGFIFRNIDPFFLFWLASIVCGVLLLSVMFWLLHKVFGFSYTRATTTLFCIAFGGGFGFLLAQYGIPSADLVYAITFYDAFLKPHEAISLIGYFYAVVMFYKYVICDKRLDVRTSFFISLSSCISFLIYPYLIISYFAVTIIALKVFKRTMSMTSCITLYAPSLLVVSFVSWQLLSNPGFFQSLTQYLPTFIFPTLFGYGILLPIFVYHIFRTKKTTLETYLTIWILISLTLAFLPFGPAKIFLRGLFFPLVVLCIGRVNVLVNKISSMSIRIAFWVVFIVLLCSTSFYIFFLRMYIVHTPKGENTFYMPQKEFEIFAYLNTHTQNNSGILAGEAMSNTIPAYTHNKTALGSIQSATNTYVDQVDVMKSFYAGEPYSENYLKENNISYVFWGSIEQNLTTYYYKGEEHITDLSKLYKNLQLVYETDTAKLYKVKK